jgi:VWFA-related protein
MRTPVAVGVVGILVLASFPAAGQEPRQPAVRYKVDIDSMVPSMRPYKGRDAVHVTVQFRIRELATESTTTDVPESDILIEEDRKEVAKVDFFQPRGSSSLTVMLAMDTSGSMLEAGKLQEAKAAGGVFLDRLHPKANCGLVLFNHDVYQVEAPIKNLDRLSFHRDMLRDRITDAKGAGGTAWIDATWKSLETVVDLEGRKAILVMTDGVDMNSKRELGEVIKRAKVSGIPVYTLGVGEPGKNEPVSTVLVLDHSGSMKGPANEGGLVSKLSAMHKAASRFAEGMRPGATTALLPFSTVPERPQPFTTDKLALKKAVTALKSQGGTALYDATYNGVETLEAARPKGKRAVVVLTDGHDEDPGSRHRVEEVIERAKEAGTPLYMLGLGQDDEINIDVMKKMAKETGGEFYHARDEKKLLEIFENLTIKLHDDGIDEASMKRLAAETGGKYFLARDVKQLQLIYEEVAEELGTTYSVTYRSRRDLDGAARGVDIKIMKDGVVQSDVATQDYTVHGVVVPEMSRGVYLALLAVLVVLMALPSGMRHLYRFYGGS